MDYTKIEDEALTAFAEIVREYCAVVEQHASIDTVEFIQAIHQLFARLYLGGLSLPSYHLLFEDDGEDAEADDYEGEENAPVPLREPDEDRQASERLAELTALSSKLGETWFYREVFDPHEPAEPEVTGSLADDISDTYRDVSAGLHKWDRGETGPALWEWRFSFETHWGEHVSGGLRAMHARAAWHELPWPPTGETARRQP